MAAVGVGGDEGEHAAVGGHEGLPAVLSVPRVGSEARRGVEGSAPAFAEGGVAGDLDGRQRMDGKVQGDGGVAAVGGGEGLDVIASTVIG